VEHPIHAALKHLKASAIESRATTTAGIQLQIFESSKEMECFIPLPATFIITKCAGKETLSHPKKHE
jgi:hypothetical protein